MTQLDKARTSQITPEMKTVCDEERIETQKLIDYISQGKIVIPYNNSRKKKITPIGIVCRTH